MDPPTPDSEHPWTPGSFSAGVLPPHAKGGPDLLDSWVLCGPHGLRTCPGLLGLGRMVPNQAPPPPGKRGRARKGKGVGPGRCLPPPFLCGLDFCN